MLRHLTGPLAGAFVALALAAVGFFLLFRFDLVTSSSTDVVHGSGVSASQTRALAPFTSVELAGSNVVTITVGSPQSVVVHADDNLLNRVTTKVHDGRLVIGNTPGDFATKSPMSVEIRVPALDALTLAGSGVVDANGIDSQDLTVSLSGSGVVRASGTTGRLDVDLPGSGDAQLSGVTARDVHAVVSGSGRILVTATESLDASVPGSGAVIYGGNPTRVTTNVTGSGAVARG